MGVSLSEGATGVLGGITTSSNVLVLLRVASAGKEICKDTNRSIKKYFAYEVQVCNLFIDR